MKKIFCLVAFFALAATAFPQTYSYYSTIKNTGGPYTYYAAAKAGLSIREQPGTNSKVLDKIPYGAKLSVLTDTAKAVAIATEGFDGWWWKVQYNGKTGYVVSSYVLPMAPPKAGTKTMKDYFAQLSSAAGPVVSLKKGNPDMEGDAETLKKQLFKNGMEWHETSGYEYGSTTYIIPDMSIEQAFLVLRLLNEFPGIIDEKDPLPVKNSSVKKDVGEKKTVVEKELWYDKVGVIKHLTISTDEGALSELEMTLLGNQVIIYYSSGV